jgi:hypothetical protein
MAVKMSSKMSVTGHIREDHNWQLILWWRVLFNNLTVTKLIKKFHAFMNSKVQNCIHKSLPLYRIMSEFNPVHTFTPCFSKIHFNIILSSIEKYFPFMFSDQNSVCFSQHNSFTKWRVPKVKVVHGTVMLLLI